MTLRDLHLCIATDNHATFTITRIGSKLAIKNVHWNDISRRYKDSEVWMAYPVEADYCAVKKWSVVLK